MGNENMENSAMVMETQASYGEQGERRIDFKILEHLCVFKSDANGWSKELNLVSWGGNKPKLDVREWSPDHAKMSKGVTFSGVEAETMFKCMQRMGFGNGEGKASASF